MTQLKFKLPKGYMNVGISFDSTLLVADTNDSSNWDEMVIPLPEGKWSILSNVGKDLVLIKSTS